MTDDHMKLLQALHDHTPVNWRANTALLTRELVHAGYLTVTPETSPTRRLTPEGRKVLDAWNRSNEE